MKEYRITNVIIAMFCIFISCDVINYNRGRIYDSREYVPKRPRYSLKDKEGNTAICGKLDTVNVYSTLEDDLIYPSPPQYRYKKFYPDGRYLSIIVDVDSVKNGFPDLNRRMYSLTKGYYYCVSKRVVQVEIFTLDKLTWPIYGSYFIDTYYLSATEDTLYTYGRIFVKETIPEAWKNFPVDW